MEIEFGVFYVKYLTRLTFPMSLMRLFGGFDVIYTLYDVLYVI